jgi:hypothetical protein
MFSDWVSFLAYPNLFGIKGFVVVVVVTINCNNRIQSWFIGDLKERILNSKKHLSLMILFLMIHFPKIQGKRCIFLINDTFSLCIFLKFREKDAFFSLMILFLIMHFPKIQGKRCRTERKGGE